MSSRNMESTPVLSAVALRAATPSCGHSVCFGSTRRAVASLSSWLPNENMYGPGVSATLGPLMGEL